MSPIKRDLITPWMRRYPIPARLFWLVGIVLVPLAVIGTIIWEHRSDIFWSFAQAVAGTFLTWEDEE